MTAQVISLPNKANENSVSLLELRARSLAKRFSGADASEVLNHAITQEFAGKAASI